MSPNIAKDLASYRERLDVLVSKVIGSSDIYDFHFDIDIDKEHINKDLTRGSVRLQEGMFVSIPESDKMEYDFIHLRLP